MADIHDIASEFDRVCPSQVDRTPRDFGEGYEAGHAGDEPDDDGGNYTIGWFCLAGNAGNLVCEIPPDRLDDVYEALRALPDGEGDVVSIDRVVREAGGIW